MTSVITPRTIPISAQTELLVQENALLLVNVSLLDATPVSTKDTPSTQTWKSAKVELQKNQCQA